MFDFHVTRVKVNQRGLGQILKGQEGHLKRDLNRRGGKVAERANRDDQRVDLSKGLSFDKGVYVSEGFTGRARYRNTVRSQRPVLVSRSPLLRSLDAAKDSGL